MRIIPQRNKAGINRVKSNGVDTTIIKKHSKPLNQFPQSMNNHYSQSNNQYEYQHALQHDHHTEKPHYYEY